VRGQRDLEQIRAIVRDEYERASKPSIALRDPAQLRRHDLADRASLFGPLVNATRECQVAVTLTAETNVSWVTQG
jgi:hypothetical protein